MSTSEPECPPSVPVDWFADGLLWAVNTMVFHPRGFALAVDPADGAMSLQGDGTERWAFGEDDATKAMTDRRFLAFQSMLARAAKANTD